MFDRAIRESIAPARVRSAIDRLLAAGAPLPLLDESSLRRFVRISEVSRFSTEILRRYAEAWGILDSAGYGPPPLEPSVGSEGLRKDLALALFEVIVVDVLEPRPFVETLSMLSKMTDRCVERAIRIASTELDPLFGRPFGSRHYEPAPGFTVIGMGKLGGRELNFLSDIDLIFLYRMDGQTGGGSRGALAHTEWYARVAERVIELLSSRVISPLGFRVDMRLRPEGNTGPLVRSLASTLRYYEREGAAWERQALIKARPIAGDLELGEEFLAEIRPFIYRKYLDREAIFQIESIKARIEAQAGRFGRRNVKLSKGGIREIEFIVQIMQLANGGRCAAVQNSSTLRALDDLAANNYLAAADAAELRDHYLFLRRVEHRLQMLDGRQNHQLPEDPEELGLLATGLGWAGGDALWEEYIERTDRVRAFYDRRFTRSKEISVTPVEEKVIEILDEGVDPERLQDVLREWGWTSVEASEMRKMARASAADPPTSSVRRTFIRSTVGWLPLLFEYPASSVTLKRLSRIVETYGAKSLLYQILGSHSAVAELLVDIAALSQPLADQIARDPSTLESLLSPGGVKRGTNRAALHERYSMIFSTAPSERKAKQLLRAEQTLRIGVRFLLGLSSVEELGGELSDLMELIVGDPPFGVVALGKFGSRNLGMASDLDLVFIAEKDQNSVLPEVQNRLEEWGKLGLKIDARLRPMGRTSQLVYGLDSLKSYFSGKAETWERIAWTRARVVAAPPKLCKQIQKMMRNFVGSRLTVDEMRSVIEMRRRIVVEAAQSRSKPPVDLKKSSGGTLGVEFLAAARMIRQKNGEYDLGSLLGDEPDLVASYRYLLLLDAAAQIVTGRGYRGDEDGSDLRRIELVLERHGAVLGELKERQAMIARKVDEELEKMAS